VVSFLDTPEQCVVVTTTKQHHKIHLMQGEYTSPVVNHIYTHPGGMLYSLVGVYLKRLNREETVAV